jgi:hypothetical protein
MPGSQPCSERNLARTLCTSSMALIRPLSALRRALTDAARGADSAGTGIGRSWCRGASAGGLAKDRRSGGRGASSLALETLIALDPIPAHPLAEQIDQAVATVAADVAAVLWQ